MIVEAAFLLSLLLGRLYLLVLLLLCGRSHRSPPALLDPALPPRLLFYKGGRPLLLLRSLLLRLIQAVSRERLLLRFKTLNTQSPLSLLSLLYTSTWIDGTMETKRKEPPRPLLVIKKKKTILASSFLGRLLLLRLLLLLLFVRERTKDLLLSSEGKNREKRQEKECLVR